MLSQGPNLVCVWIAFKFSGIWFREEQAPVA